MNDGNQIKRAKEQGQLSQRLEWGWEGYTHISNERASGIDWVFLSFLDSHRTCRCADGKHWGHEVPSNSLSALSCLLNQQWKPDKDSKPLGRSTIQSHSSLLGPCFSGMLLDVFLHYTLIKDYYFRRKKFKYRIIIYNNYLVWVIISHDLMQSRCINYVCTSKACKNHSPIYTRVARLRGVLLCCLIIMKKQISIICSNCKSFIPA